MLQTDKDQYNALLQGAHFRACVINTTTQNRAGSSEVPRSVLQTQWTKARVKESSIV